MSTQAKRYFESGKMTNLVLVNIVEIMQFFNWFFIVAQCPFVLILATVYIVI